MKAKNKIRSFIASVIVWRYFPLFILLLFVFVVGFSLFYFSDPERVNSKTTPYVWVGLVGIILFIIASIVSFVVSGPSGTAKSLQTGIRMDYRGLRSTTTKLYLDYKRTLTIEDFHLTIIPLLESIEKMNNRIGVLLNRQETENLYIRQLHYASPLQIDIGGFIPQTLEVLRQLLRDKEFRITYEKKMAELELVKTQLELTQKRLENQNMMLDNTRKIIDLVLPNATIEQRHTLAAAISPELRLILEKHRELATSQSLVQISSPRSAE